MRAILLPCLAVGVGTGNVVIRSVSGRRVRVRGVGTLVLVGREVYVRLEVAEETDRLSRVRHPDGSLTWVRTPRENGERR